MGHKVSDGNSVVVAAPAGGVIKDNPYEIANFFGFADADAAAGASVSLSIGQEEREVTLPGKAGGWALGDPVYWDVAVPAFDDVVGTGRLVGQVTRALAAAGGVTWVLIHPGAWNGI